MGQHLLSYSDMFTMASFSSRILTHTCQTMSQASTLFLFHPSTHVTHSTSVYHETNSTRAQNNNVTDNFHLLLIIPTIFHKLSTPKNIHF